MHGITNNTMYASLRNVPCRLEYASCELDTSLWNDIRSYGETDASMGPERLEPLSCQETVFTNVCLVQWLTQALGVKI